MTLPYSDPSNPALPSPLFSDLTAVRADHMRANNAAIFADLTFLDVNNPAIVALAGGSFKTSALANANTYNGRSMFTCTAGVSDTPYSGAWRVAGFWNPTDSSGRFVAMLDSTNETWEITYTGAAWGAWALVGYGETAFDRKAFVQSMGGVWCEFVGISNTQIQIKPKAANGYAAFIGVILNNGKYIETTTAITRTLSPAGAGGHIIDGITAVLNNEWYIPWFYENSGGELDVGFSWMPQTQFTNANPTTALTLKQVNAQDVGFLFNPNADLMIFESAAKFETPIFDTTGAAYKPTGAKYVASRTATVVTLDSACSVANYSANTGYVVQLNNFKPLQISDGAIAAAIGARGYKDSGLRVRTNGSANILPFTVSENWFTWSNGNGAADARPWDDTSTTNTSYITYRMTYIPPDKTSFRLQQYVNSLTQYIADYWATYGTTLMSGSGINANFSQEIPILHQLFKRRADAANGNNFGSLGYKI